MCDAIDLFRQIAEALELTPGELMAFSSLARGRLAEIREHAEALGQLWQFDDRPDPTPQVLEGKAARPSLALA